MDKKPPVQGYRDPATELRQQQERADALERRLQSLKSRNTELRKRASSLTRELNRQKHLKSEWEWFFTHSQEMLCVAGLDGYFKRVNPAFVSNFGHPEQDLLNRPIVDFVHPDDVYRTLNELKALGQGIDSLEFENRYRDNTGRWHWISWHCPALTGDTEYLYAIARDITEQKRTEADLLYRASHDGLTNLLNRTAFEDALEQAIARAERNSDIDVALYLIDLDGFKAINDTHGHLVGDDVLKTLARRFKHLQRSHELVCRLGGDEFAWLAEDRRPIETTPLAERIMAAVGKPIRIGYQSFSLRCCIGISRFAETAGDKTALLSQADDVMYRIKRSGRSGYALHH